MAPLPPEEGESERLFPKCHYAPHLSPLLRGEGAMRLLLIVEEVL
jgi:hypothetical protein